MRIAILEDDRPQLDILDAWLDDAGHDCSGFTDADALCRSMRRESYDLLVLDWNLPRSSGPEVLAWVREHVDWRVPVLFTTARDREEDVVLALEGGADDYLVKPLRHRETVARITALARRVSSPLTEEGRLEEPPYSFDVERQQASLHGETVNLTGKEFQLAVFLFRNPGRLLSRGHILEAVWGKSGDLNTRTVDTHISRLRSKLNLGEENAWRLSSVYQHGYRLERLGDGAG